MSTEGLEGGNDCGQPSGPSRTRFSKRASGDDRGLRCRACGCRDLRVIYKRDRIGGARRKRRCRNCGRVMWTMEQQPQA